MLIVQYKKPISQALEGWLSLEVYSLSSSDTKQETKANCLLPKSRHSSYHNLEHMLEGPAGSFTI